MAGFLSTFDLVPLDVLMILVWAIAFTFFWQFLEKFLFNPFIEIIEKREEQTDGYALRARLNNEKNAAIEREIKHSLSEARRRSITEKNEKLLEARKAAAKIIDSAETEAAEIVRSERWKIEENFADARKQLLEKVEELSQAAASNIEHI